MSSDNGAVPAFQQGFGIVVFRILSSGSSIFQERRVKSLLIGIVISLAVIYVITVPIRILLYILQLLMSIFSSSLANMLKDTRLSITFFSIFFDAFWYIPLFILFISRALGLFPQLPFDNAIMNKNGSFGSRLLNAETKQTVLTSLMHLTKRIAQLLAVSAVIFVLRLIPGVRIIVSIAILGYQLYKRIFKVNYHINNIALTLIILAVTVLFSGSIAKALLYFSELYLTSQALSREFLTPYFCKVSYEMEKRDKRNYQWLLFGYGSAVTLCFAIPLGGLIFYPIFQQAAADVLIVMLNQKKLSFANEMY
eukprot:541873_1